MKTARGSRSRGKSAASPNDLELTELVQSRVSPDADKRLRAEATDAGISFAAHVRRILYRHLGLITTAVDKET